MDTVSGFHAKAPQATASEGLAQGPYVARAGFEPKTLRTKGDESTNEPPNLILKYIETITQRWRTFFRSRANILNLKNKNILACHVHYFFYYIRYY